MRTRKLLLLFLGAGLVAVELARPSAAQDKKPAQGGAEIIVTDYNGKEHKVKNWKFTAGTAHLSWLAEGPAEAKEPKDKKDTGKKKGGPVQAPAVGPEAFEFSPGLGPVYKRGFRIMVYVPLENIRSIDFDHEKKTATVKVAKEGGDEELEGKTGYVGVNVLTIVAEADLGEFGVGQIKFEGGVERGIKSVRFPSAKAAPAPKGRYAEVIQTEKDKTTTYKVMDLQPLYKQADGLLRAVPTLFFQKTVKLDVAKVARLSQLGAKGDNWDVTLKSGNSQALEIIKRPADVNGKPAVLEGLVGRSAVGYFLFPLSEVSEAYFDKGKKKEDV
jgi:hypothetical protein